MNILAGLDTPTAGAVWVAGRNLGAMTAKERLAYRRSVAGFIWQQTSRNLLPYLTARQNVLLPMRLSSSSHREHRRRAGLLLDTLGIAHCADRTPDRMSGGEQQRAAIATALANRPKVLLADEPTGELDSVTASEVMRLLRTLNQQLGLTILIVTHDVAIAAEVDRTLAIRDGRTSTETVRRDAPLEEVHAQTPLASAIIGLSSQTHRESILIDRVGRLQLPKEALELYPFYGRAEVRFAEGHIQLWPLNSTVGANRGNGHSSEAQSPAKQAGDAE